jgi:hypothetical protein
MTIKFPLLKELTELFEANIAQYKSLQYDEANTRTDFIDKFFALLDWDIANNQGFSEVYEAKAMRLFWMRQVIILA